MISVIIPLYNVEKYMDRCLNSVVNQTFKNLEIILINDGSTDRTLQKCFEWQQYDNRIRVINQENQGQGKARNHGIGSATGEYLAFIDGDDWWELEAMQKAHQRMLETDAEVVIFDTVCIDYFNDKVTGSTAIKNQFNIKEITNVTEDPSLIYKISGVLWDKLWKRECFVKTPMPGYPFEDEYIVNILLSNVNRISQIKESLYYYIARKESTVFNKRSLIGLERAFIDIRDFYNIQNKPKYFYDMIRIKAMVVYQNILRNLYRVCTEDEIVSLQKDAEQYLNKEFPLRKVEIQTSVMLIGSYNLRAIMKRIDAACDSKIVDFSRSSVISFMQPGMVNLAYDFQNKYQENMWNKELSRLAGYTLEQGTVNCKYAVLDFLEETKGIIEIDHQYMTYFPEIEEKLIEDGIKYRRIEFLSEEFFVLWKQFIAQFVKGLERNFVPKQIILMYNYLNEYKIDIKDLKKRADIHVVNWNDILMTDEFDVWIARKRNSEDLYFGNLGYERDYYDGLPEILKKNQRLREMYDYFIHLYPNTQVLRIPEEYYGTDQFYAFGVSPENMNEAYYLQAADQIKKIIEEAL